MTLAVAMGVGRFAYTPLLAVMERDAGLSVGLAGTLAFANLFGYLAGASLALHPAMQRRRIRAIRVSLACIVVATAAMALPSPGWLALRSLTGVASGFVFVFASSIALETAARERAPWMAPAFFSGVGLGIALSGVAVPAFAALGGSRAAWIGLALVAAAAIRATGRWFTEPASDASARSGRIASSHASGGSGFVAVVAVYAAEAFAYIIPATFLVAIVRGIPSLGGYADAVWIVVGLSAACATVGWIAAGERLGKARSLALALAIQAAGIAALAFSNAIAALIVGAVTLGGTFIAIALFASGLGRDLFPLATSGAVSRLTIAYGIGQMLGPLVATALALRTGTYHGALVAASAVAGLAALATLVWVRDPITS